jgi:hypothetical protein
MNGNKTVVFGHLVDSNTQGSVQIVDKEQIEFVDGLTLEGKLLGRVEGQSQRVELRGRSEHLDFEETVIAVLIREFVKQLQDANLDGQGSVHGGNGLDAVGVIGD